jgi:RNA polymerase sigma-70 factor (ECF subfamily)
VSALRQPAEERLTGPPFCFRHVFEQYGRYVWRALRRLGIAEADVPDIAQDVFMILREKLASVHSPEALRPFIYGIALRRASDYRRSARVRRETLAYTPPEPSVDAPQEEELQKEHALAMLRSALDELDEDKRAVFVLYELEELNMREVVAVVGCPMQTAYSRLHAARRTVTAAFRRAERGQR